MERIPNSCLLLLHEGPELLVEVTCFLWELSVPQTHSTASFINQVDCLIGQEPADKIKYSSKFKKSACGVAHEQVHEITVNCNCATLLG